MKFKDFLNESVNANAKNWLKEHVALSPVNPTYDDWDIEKIWEVADPDEIGCQINAKTGALVIWGVADVTINMKGQDWNCPFESNLWEPDQFGMQLSNVKFAKGKKLKNIPNVGTLAFHHCEIETFEVDGKPLNKVEHLEIQAHTKVNCGLLKLLKRKDYPALEGMSVAGSDKRLAQAAKILNTYLMQDGDIVEFQTELIDEGLDEYAKL